MSVTMIDNRRDSAGEKVERGVSGALRVGRPYGYHVIISSTSDAPLLLDVLVQVPQARHQTAHVIWGWLATQPGAAVLVFLGRAQPCVGLLQSHCRSLARHARLGRS